MEKLLLVITFALVLMAIGFILQLVKAWIGEIRYNSEKRKAIKENSPDSWVYKI